MLDTMICQIKLNSILRVSFMVVNLVEFSFVFFLSHGIKKWQRKFYSRDNIMYERLNCRLALAE